MPIKYETSKGKAFTSVKTPDGVESVKEEEVGQYKTDSAEAPLSQVGFKLGYTKNLGNYESLRVDVSIQMPCHKDELSEVAEFERKWVNERMDLTVEEIEKELSGG